MKRPIIKKETKNLTVIYVNPPNPCSRWVQWVQIGGVIIAGITLLATLF